MEKAKHDTGTLLAPLYKKEISMPKGCSIPTEIAHMDHFTTSRKAAYRGKSIEVRTEYTILIDGSPLMTHVSVNDDGSVHCHGLPQYSFASTLDMARAIIDASDVKIPKNELG